jgi:hypothetical protein
MSHPQDYNTLKFDVYRKYYSIVQIECADSIIITQEEIESYLKEHQVSSEVCPRCNSINIAKRKTLDPPYRCNKCQRKFREEDLQTKLLPEYIDDRENRENIKNLTNRITWSMINDTIKRDSYNNLVKKNYSAQIEYEAIIEYIEQNIRYLSMEDTKTFCKKCAFMWDKNYMDLCPECKVGYKKFSREKCYACWKKDTQDHGPLQPPL